jgi:hypothetical protein
LKGLTNINNLLSIVLWESGYLQLSQQKLTTMPSASSSRYQSRLFNFFHQQSRRLGEQFERTVRQIKVTASWSIEGFLHSVYMLIQKTVESSGRQLNAGEQKTSLYLQGYVSDAQRSQSQSTDSAIVRVLEVVPTLQIKDQTVQEDRNKSFFPTLNFTIFHYLHPLVLHSQTSQSPIANSQSPIGIASNLPNRNLVLVTANNDILDILTFQQQKKLQNRIYKELRVCEAQQLAESALDESQILPEIDCLLNKLISGKQENESVLPTEAISRVRLAPRAIAKDKDFRNNVSIPLQRLAKLDETIAKLEANTLVPISRTSSELFQAAQTQLNIFIYGKQQSITSTEKVLSTEAGENPTLNILSLIWEAIYYFFGEKSNRDLESDLAKTLPENSKKTSQIQETETVAPWLSIDDLFDRSLQVKEVENEPQSSESIIEANFTLPKNLSYRQKILHYFQSKASKLKNILSSENRQKSLAVNSQFQIIEFDSQRMKGQTSKFNRQTYAVEAKPDWIETSARTIGYVKHPLEIILEWLDLAILWIERFLINIFLFFKGFLRGK